MFSLGVDEVVSVAGRRGRRFTHVASYAINAHDTTSLGSAPVGFVNGKEGNPWLRRLPGMPTSVFPKTEVGVPVSFASDKRDTAGRGSI